MRRIMMTQQKAMAAERTWWFGTAWTILALGVASKKAPPAAAAALFPIGMVTAYTWDMGYGTKLDRINEMQRAALREEGHFWSDTIEELEVVLKYGM